MARLPQQFRSNEHGDMRFEALPKGKYLAKLIHSEEKKTKDFATNGGNKYYEFTFEILNPKYKGRKVKSIMNLVNTNKKAVEIAFNELNTLAKACGKPVFDDTVELHGIPISITLNVVQDNRGEDYPEQNKIMFYDKAGAADDSGTSGADENGGKKKKMPWEEDEEEEAGDTKEDSAEE